MQEFKVDLTNCDRELIHIPGKIQSHGFMLAVDNEANIRFYSDNINEFLPGITGDIIGQHLNVIEKLLVTTQQHGFISHLIYFGKINKSFELTNPFLINIDGKPFYLIISSAGGYYMLEFEPAVSDFDLDAQKKINRSISEMLSEKNVQNLLSNTARQVKNIIHFDRVMIYRFSEKGHGQVVAEDRNPELPSWLGLCYPASDIPKQARELYKINLTRLIFDVESVTSEISTIGSIQDPLDLSNAQLRAVSPMHIQYLKNMGVASSFSISLLYKSELWGLIACHNYTPKFIDYKSRESSKMLGQILSSALEFRQDEENQLVLQNYKNNLAVIAKSLQKNTSIADALTQTGESNLLDITNASGAVLFYEEKIIRLGATPNNLQLTRLANWIKGNVEDGMFVTTELSSSYPQAKAFESIASGMLVTVLSRELGEYIIWFKPELIQTVNWAGNPDKPVETDASGLMHMSPRRSFDLWSETVSGTAASWTNEELISVAKLKEEITYAVNEKAGTIRVMNEKLRQAYEELDTFSFTISHDLKSPISAIKGYAQVLGADQTIGERWRRVAERIEDRADKMNQMINEVLDYSRIGRSEIIYQTINVRSLIDEITKDLLLVYNTIDLQIIIGETPTLHGDPIMMLQIFSNLIGNAVKYSQFSKPPRVEIKGWTEGKTTAYEIKDNGLGIAASDIPHIFELFNRLQNVKEIEGSGVGLAIVKRIIDRHKGRIWLESAPDKGSSFFIEFNN